MKTLCQKIYHSSLSLTGDDSCCNLKYNCDRRANICTLIKQLIVKTLLQFFSYSTQIDISIMNSLNIEHQTPIILLPHHYRHCRHYPLQPEKRLGGKLPVYSASAHLSLRRLDPLSHFPETSKESTSVGC